MRIFTNFICKFACQECVIKLFESFNSVFKAYRGQVMAPVYGPEEVYNIFEGTYEWLIK